MARFFLTHDRKTRNGPPAGGRGRPKGRPLSASERAQRTTSAQKPRKRLPVGVDEDAQPKRRGRKAKETFAEARTRREIAAADTAEINRDSARISLQLTRGTLVKADAVRDRLEKIHARWVSEVEQLAGLASAAMPVDQTIRDQISATIEKLVRDMRERIAS